jgi:hypothetical protein
MDNIWEKAFQKIEEEQQSRMCEKHVFEKYVVVDISTMWEV